MRVKTQKKKYGQKLNHFLYEGNANSKTLIVLLIIFLFAVGFYIGMRYQFWILESNMQNNHVALINPQIKSKYICSQYGEITDKSQFLQKYTVQPGNSLLSIAKQQLNDVSKVGEIIALNKDMYPDLSLDNSFLEQGMTLYLPDKNWPLSSDDLVQIAGQVTEIDNGNSDDLKDERIVINGPTFVSSMLSSNSSIYSQNKQVKVGDCIKSVVELNSTGQLIYLQFLN